jgi:hypothetical protein
LLGNGAPIDIKDLSEIREKTGKCMYKYYLVVLILAMGLSSKGFAETIHTNDFKVIQKQVQQSGVDTLVIFDLNDVIIYPNDEIFHTRNKEHLIKLDKDLLSRKSKEEVVELRKIAVLSREYNLVDKRIIDTLRYLKQKGINTIALTHCGTGKKGSIESREDLRVHDLKTLGIDFSALSNLKDQRFPDVKAKDGQPLLKSGIVFTGNVDKGVILNAILSATGLQPKKIIFIDNKLENVHSIEIAAKERAIEFVGIEYTAIKDAKHAPLNQERANLQFKLLEKDQKWLSDKEADQMLLSSQKS